MIDDLLAHVAAVKRLEVPLHHKKTLSEDEVEQFLALLTRQIQGEPLAYILGSIPFFQADIDLNSSVLIPRPETEQWVARLAAKLKSPLKVLDLCTGSGAIGVSLKKQCPFLEVTLADISPEALRVASHNAQKNQVDVRIVQSNFLDKIEGSFDLILCNPPYIAEAEWDDLALSVKNFEPPLALTAPDNGLYFYRKLAKEARLFLNPGAELWMEIGAGQGDDVKKIFYDFGTVVLDQDWSGLDRLVRVKV